MGHTKNVRDGMALLGLESLKNLALDQLRKMLDTKSSEISSQGVVHIYCAWLKDQLEIMDNSEEDTFIREITSWCQTLQSCVVDAGDILTDFVSWQQEHIQIDSSSARRLNLAELEIRKLLSSATVRRTHASQPLVTAETFQGIHPDRMGMVAEQRPEPIFIDLENWKTPVIEISSDPIFSPAEPESKDLGFLTGSNRMVFENDMASNTHQNNGLVVNGNEDVTKDTAPSTRPKSSSRPNSARVTKNKKSSNPTTKKNAYPPAEGYRCNRCGVSGHWLHDCTKQMGSDPIATGPPPRGFLCRFCKKTGHWFSDCSTKRSDGRTMPYRQQVRDRQDKPRARADEYRPRSINTGSSKSGDRADPSQFTDRGQRVPDRRSRSRSPGRSWEHESSPSQHRPSRLDRSYSYSPYREQAASLPGDHEDDGGYGLIENRPWNESDDADMDGGVGSAHSKHSRKAVNTKQTQPALRPGIEIPKDDLGRLSYWDEAPRYELPERKYPIGDDEDIAMCSSSDTDDQINSDFFAADDLLCRLKCEMESRSDDAKLDDATSRRTSLTKLERPTASEDDAAESENELPIVLIGVSSKNIEGDSAYGAQVMKLFKHRKNIWVNKSTRISASRMWRRTDLCPGLAPELDGKISGVDDMKLEEDPLAHDTVISGKGLDTEDETSEDRKGTECKAMHRMSLKDGELFHT